MRTRMGFFQNSSQQIVKLTHYKEKDGDCQQIAIEDANQEQNSRNAYSGYIIFSYKDTEVLIKTLTCWPQNFGLGKLLVSIVSVPANQLGLTNFRTLNTYPAAMNFYQGLGFKEDKMSGFVTGEGVESKSGKRAIIRGAIEWTADIANCKNAILKKTPFQKRWVMFPARYNLILEGLNQSGIPRNVRNIFEVRGDFPLLSLMKKLKTTYQLETCPPVFSDLANIAFAIVFGYLAVHSPSSFPHSHKMFEQYLSKFYKKMRAGGFTIEEFVLFTYEEVRVSKKDESSFQKSTLLEQVMFGIKAFLEGALPLFPSKSVLEQIDECIIEGSKELMRDDKEAGEQFKQRYFQRIRPYLNAHGNQTQDSIWLKHQLAELVTIFDAFDANALLDANGYNRALKGYADTLHALFFLPRGHDRRLPNLLTNKTTVQAIELDRKNRLVELLQMYSPEALERLHKEHEDDPHFFIEEPVENNLSLGL